MNGVVSRGSVLIAAAVLAACAGKQEEAERQVAVFEERAEVAQDQAVQDVIVTGSRSAGNSSSAHVRRAEADKHIAYQVAPAPAAIAAPAFAPPPPYQQPHDTERYQHQQDNPVRLVAEHPVS